MLQRLAQFRVALLEFFEEADVLDGDDGLSGKSLNQFNLLVSEVVPVFAELGCFRPAFPVSARWHG